MKQGTKLRAFLLEKDMTQRCLGEKTGIPEAYISHFIHGRFIFPEESQLKIAEALGIRKEDIFESDTS